MRVTHVTPTMFGDQGTFGGGERYPLELCRALATEIECRLVGYGSKAARSREADGLEVVILPRMACWRGHPAYPLGPGLRRATAGADIVHVHHMRSSAGRAAALVASARRQALVATDHGLGGGGWGGLLPALFDHFAVVSSYSARVLRSPRNKTTVVYGGVDPTRFRPGNEIRNGVVFVGRITPHKALDRLLLALPDDVSLTVVGTGGHDPRPPHSGYPGLVHALSGGKDVRFAGQAPDRYLPELYRRAQVMVLPSVHDTCYGTRVEISELLGLSALEAMASGTPVICSRVGGLPEVVDDGVTGILVEPGDVVALRHAIETLVGDRKRAAEMGRAGRERVLERFTWQHCAHRCLSIYEELSSRAAA